MPGWLQTFTDVQPAVQARGRGPRADDRAGPVAHAVWVTLGWSVAITAVMAPIAIPKFRKKT